MDAETFESLLHQSESETLDFKSKQYPFTNEEEKSELLKDILAFANAWKLSDGYILIGVEEEHGRAKNVCGADIDHKIGDANLQQFVNSKTNKPVSFQVEVIQHKGANLTVIKVGKSQQRPIYLRKSFGRLKSNAVYIRRGSSTIEATPDEVADMGSRTRNQPVAIYEIETKITIRRHSSLFELYLETCLRNRGNATADDIQVDVTHDGNKIREINFQQWKDKQASHPARGQSALNPLHQGDKLDLFTLPLGLVVLNQEQTVKLGFGEKVWPTPPINYDGSDVGIHVRIFARDLSPADIAICYSKEQIEKLTPLVFRSS